MPKITTVLFGELAFLPVQAQAPVSEILEWLTELNSSHNGTETTTQLRQNPRQTLSYIMPESAAVSASAFAAQYGGFRSSWAVPLWCEAQYVGSVALSSFTLECVTDIYDFRASSLALLYQSSDNWQVIEIDTLISGELSLLVSTQAFSSAWLMPIRLASLEGSITRKSSGYDVISEIKYEILDNLALSETTPSQFLGDDIYTVPTLKGGDRIDAQIQTNVAVNDYEIGKVSKHYPWLYNVVSRANNVMCENASQVRDFKKWLMRRAGKLRRYWEPSFECDLNCLSVGTVTTALRVADNGYLDWLPLRNHIAIETTAGVWHARKIDDAFIVSPGIIQLTLDSALNISASAIARISFLGLKRFNTDRIEIQWPGAGIAKSSISTIEIQP